jgi:hypothetical protein
MSHPAPTRFQFSLRWLFVAVTVLAVVLGTWALFGAMLLWLIVGVLLPAQLVIVALFGRGALQSAAIGALVPWLVWSFGSASRSLSVASLLFLLVAYVVSGGLAVVTKAWLDRRAAL